MRHRLIRQRSTGKLLQFVHTIAADEFEVSADSHLRDAARGWGLVVTDLEAVEGEGDPPALPADALPCRPQPVSPADSAIARLREWATDASNPPVTRAVVLDILRVLRRL